MKYGLHLAGGASVCDRAALPEVGDGRRGGTTVF